MYMYVYIHIYISHVRTQVPTEQAAALFYKHSPVLMQHAPDATVHAWKVCAAFLDPIKLIPCLVRYSDQRRVALSIASGRAGWFLCAMCTA